MQPFETGKSVRIPQSKDWLEAKIRESFEEMEVDTLGKEYQGHLTIPGSRREMVEIIHQEYEKAITDLKAVAEEIQSTIDTNKKSTYEKIAATSSLLFEGSGYPERRMDETETFNQAQSVSRGENGRAHGFRTREDAVHSRYRVQAHRP